MSKEVISCFVQSKIAEHWCNDWNSQGVVGRDFVVTV